MLDEATLADIFTTKNDRKRKPASKGKVIVRTSEGLQVQNITKMGDHNFGQYIGKVGSVRRTRKGKTSRVPNGYVKYISPSITDTDEVVAYVLK